MMKSRSFLRWMWGLNALLCVLLIVLSTRIQQMRTRQRGQQAQQATMQWAEAQQRQAQQAFHAAYANLFPSEGKNIEWIWSLVAEAARQSGLSDFDLDPVPPPSPHWSYVLQSLQTTGLKLAPFWLQVTVRGTRQALADISLRLQKDPAIWLRGITLETQTGSQTPGEDTLRLTLQSFIVTRSSRQPGS